MAAFDYSEFEKAKTEAKARWGDTAAFICAAIESYASKQEAMRDGCNAQET